MDQIEKHFAEISVPYAFAHGVEHPPAIGLEPHDAFSVSEIHLGCDVGQAALDRAAAKSIVLNHHQLLESANGRLFGDGAPRLPLPPMLAFDTVWDLSDSGHLHGLGGGSASIPIDRLGWIFNCHFASDPVIPGTFIVDGLLQLIGLNAAMQGYKGKGRLARVGSARFLREVTPHNSVLKYRIDIRRSSMKQQSIVADGIAEVDGHVCVEASNLFLMIRDA